MDEIQERKDCTSRRPPAPPARRRKDRPARAQQGRLERQAGSLGQMDRAIDHTALSGTRLFWWPVLLRTAMVDGPHLVRRQGREVDRGPGPRWPAHLHRA